MTNHDVDRLAEFNVLGVLGYGANTTIYAVQAPRSGQIFALKRVILNDPSEQRFVDQVVNEYKVGKALDHPTLRKCYELRRIRKRFQLRELLLVMELIDGKNLVRQRPPTLLELVNVFIATADGLDAMHKAGYLHADMKPNNILVTENREVKLIDFGQSCSIGAVKERIQGTPDYIAPEQVKRRALTPETDVFNLGASLYWCVTDTHIPTLIPKDATRLRIRKDNPEDELIPPIELNRELPMPLNNLILQCLKYRPDRRPASMQEVKARLELVARMLDREQPSRVES